MRYRVLTIGSPGAEYYKYWVWDTFGISGRIAHYPHNPLGHKLARQLARQLNAK